MEKNADKIILDQKTGCVGADVNCTRCLMKIKRRHTAFVILRTNGFHYNDARPPPYFFITSAGSKCSTCRGNETLVNGVLENQLNRSAVNHIHTVFIYVSHVEVLLFKTRGELGSITAYPSILFASSC